MPIMNDLWFYDALSRSRFGYRTKIMVVAFLGTHVPLLALIGFFVVRHSSTWQEALPVLVVSLLATLAGTGVTLFVLNHLLRPILKTSRGLRRYAADRVLPNLPTGYTDEAGTLMADASYTLGKLDGVLDELASMDQVTALPNRSRFVASVEERLGRDGAFAVCVVSLQNLDRIGSAFGQGAADAIARLFARRLEAVLPAGSAPARLEGGLFAFRLDANDADPAFADRTSAALADLSPEMVHGEIELMPELRIGVSLRTAETGDAEALLNEALAAVAETPDALPVTFFSPSARDAAQTRFRLEYDLRKALERGELALHYQPFVDLQLGRIVGAEALMRWTHPERGMISPAEFIPVAETSGLIEPIGAWAIGEACRQLKTWAPRDDAFKVAVNLSARQFLNPQIIKLIRGALDRNGVDPRQLEVELTETAVMSDTDYTRKILTRLRDLGLSVAIDDFGSGYSSMSYIKNLPFSKLKIDREFVSGVDHSRSSQAICRALVELTRGLDIEVLAEGAETAEEVKTLHELGCDIFQGYYFAKPMPADVFASDLTALRIAPRIMASVA